MSPIISVIIPVYNAQDHLNECLDSLINQSLRDIEIICVDDGSTDNSLAISQQYAQKDNRINVLPQSNQSAGAARNHGLTKATGKYVYFLDADDWIEETALAGMVDLIEEKQVPFLKFRARLYDNEAKKLLENGYGDWIDPCYLDNYVYQDSGMVELPDTPWSGLYNRSFLEKNHIYFDPFVCNNDCGFFMRCVAHTKRTYYSSQYFVHHRCNVQKSLITRRAEHFECVTSLLDVIDSSLTHLPPNIQYIIKQKLVIICLHWWWKCLKHPSNTWKIYDKMYALMTPYIEHAKYLCTTKFLMKQHRLVKKKLLLEKVLRIFSVRKRAGEIRLFLFGKSIKLQ
ncbi:MAG: glycosyltransferase [Elusimicrobiaceae bacterium]|nr:glycosyltransferase [Elusimicrobiaceae bacterium]